MTNKETNKFELRSKESQVRRKMKMDWRVDRMALNNDRENFRKVLIGMPSSSLPFHCKRERKEILISTAVKSAVCIYFSHAGLNKCKDWNHTEYDLKIHWYVS